jgi:uncharacterized protein YsxB (DUF464 family)
MLGPIVVFVCAHIAALVSNCFNVIKKVGRLRSYLSWIIRFMEAVGGVLNLV